MFVVQIQPCPNDALTILYSIQNTDWCINAVQVLKYTVTEPTLYGELQFKI